MSLNLGQFNLRNLLITVFVAAVIVGLIKSDEYGGIAVWLPTTILFGLLGAGVLGIFQIKQMVREVLEEMRRNSNKPDDHPHA